MKTDMTSTQAIILYTTIETLCNQFDRDNKKALAVKASAGDKSEITKPSGQPPLPPAGC
jgi:hypothetical protein